MGLLLVKPRCCFLDPLVEDLALLRDDLSWGSLGEDLSLALPLVAASVPEAMLVAVLTLVVAGAVLNLTPEAI